MRTSLTSLNSRACAVVIGVLVPALLTSGCGGHPKDLLEPIASQPRGAKVEMFVATTRKPSARGGELFSGERGAGLSFAEIDISIPPESSRQIGEIAWPRRHPVDPATDFATLKADIVSQEQAEKAIRESVAATPDGSILVFVHGFNTPFENAVFRMAQIVHDTGTPSVPLLMTWPSRGNVLSYGYDRESANYSRDALESLLESLAAMPEVRSITLLAHSMGNWLTLESLRQMAIRNGHIHSTIHDVVLAAPDVDIDVFRTQFNQMDGPRPRFSLFLSRDDRALALSGRVWGDAVRLGDVDPEVSPHREAFEEADIAVYDLTERGSRDRFHHEKFAEAPEIVKLLGPHLADAQLLADHPAGISDRIVSATSGAAAAAGAAAGIVVSAPAAIFGPIDGR